MEVKTGERKKESEEDQIDLTIEKGATYPRIWPLTVSEEESDLILEYAEGT